MKRAILLITVVFAFVFAAPAFAQQKVTDEAFGVSTVVPEGWTTVEGNERAVFNFKEEESQSQIEIIGTRLMTADVADVFFDTFHETLENSGFTRQEGSGEEVTIGGHTGKRSRYSFTHTGVTLTVPVFQFVQDSVAWLVVGYIQEDLADQYEDVFTRVIEDMTVED